MAVKKKSHPLKGKPKSKAHRAAISEGLKRHHANKKKPTAVRTKTGKIKADKKTVKAAHDKLNAIEQRAKLRKAANQEAERQRAIKAYKSLKRSGHMK